jgi:hypothetical protein
MAGTRSSSSSSSSTLPSNARLGQQLFTQLVYSLKTKYSMNEEHPLVKDLVSRNNNTMQHLLNAIDRDIRGVNLKDQQLVSHLLTWAINDTGQGSYYNDTHTNCPDYAQHY